MLLGGNTDHDDGDDGIEYLGRDWRVGLHMKKRKEPRHV